MMMKQNFSNQQPNGAVKRSADAVIVGSKAKKQPPKERASPHQRSEVSVSTSAATSNGGTPPKKVFNSPDILPEVSITLNPHPESASKRLTPETSYDVSCFKPFGPANGIPPLTPINAQPTILKSPIKRSLIPSLKGADDGSKKFNGSACDDAKRPRVENGPCTPSPLTSNNKSGEKVSSPQQNSNKSATVRHQSMPKLIDINAPFAKSQLNKLNAGRPNVTSALTIKPPAPADQTNNALDLTSPTNGGGKGLSTPSAATKVISPEKKKLLPRILPMETSKSPQQLLASVGKVEQKLLSPISAKIERKSLPITPKASSQNRKRQALLSTKAKQPSQNLSSAVNPRSTSANDLQQAFASPTLLTPHYFPNPMNTLYQQQQPHGWMFTNMNCPIPPHPLMNPQQYPLLPKDMISSNKKK
jgi:hypothetical protein